MYCAQPNTSRTSYFVLLESSVMNMVEIKKDKETCGIQMSLNINTSEGLGSSQGAASHQSLTLEPSGPIAVSTEPHDI